MPSRDTNIGKPEPEVIPVNVETNIDVVVSLTKVITGLVEVVEELRKTQTALSFILGQEIDTEEE